MNLGMALFGVGVVLAVIGGAKAPLEGETWPDTLPLFLAGAVLAQIGIVMWRMQGKKEAKKETLGSGNALSLLLQLTDALKEESAGWKDLDCADLSARVASFQEKYVVPFVENRQQLIVQFGMAKGSEILIACSYGERMLNRVWSASADKHLAEARASLEEVIDAFAQVRPLLDGSRHLSSSEK